MSTDPLSLVEWLRSQLDSDEQRYSVIMSAGLDDRRFELRTVAAHRAILDEIEGELADDPAQEMVRDRLLLLASIYEDRPGFDPSWKTNT